MSNERAGFTRVLVRAGVVPAVVFVATAASLVGTGLVAANTAASEADTVVPPEPEWRAAYSRQFPGCVSTVLWPVGERPVAFVVEQRSGEVTWVSVEDAVRLASHASIAEDVWIIGACRARG